MDNEKINLLICGYDIDHNFMFNASSNSNGTYYITRTVIL